MAEEQWHEDDDISEEDALTDDDDALDAEEYIGDLVTEES